MTRHEPRTQGKAKIDGGVASDEKHDSARKHVSGEAI